MGELKNFIDALAKHKLLVYFVILWGAMLFLRTVYGIVEWGFVINDAGGVLDLLFHLSELLAAASLLILGVKLVNVNLLKAIKTERLLIFFLILWGASFLFWGLFFIVDFGPRVLEEGQNIIEFLGDGLAAFFAGVALELFSWKMLTKPEQQTK